MGIHYYNNSGLPDPTAHLAVRHLEEEEKTLYIKYPTGKMAIRMDKFFPSTLERAKKLFRLMAAYSSEKDCLRLLEFLKQKEQKLRDQEEKFCRKAMESTKKADISKYESFARSASNDKHRIQRNMELLCQICKVGVKK